MATASSAGGGRILSEVGCAGRSREGGSDRPTRRNEKGNGGGNAPHVANLAAPAAYHRRDAGSELDRRTVVEFSLQLPSAWLRCGYDRRTGRTAVLGIAKAPSTQGRAYAPEHDGSSVRPLGIWRALSGEARPGQGSPVISNGRVSAGFRPQPPATSRPRRYAHSSSHCGVNGCARTRRESRVRRVLPSVAIDNLRMYPRIGE